ncbi:hypothetical protein CLV24_109163 [Pontibacter ummariensis]|uniref:Uncharacterized protein n=1 Tax=Pontibacter ummariensis TaxID=1610492 RepID=A0A239FJZ6_9BACT|nr:hypothetical protein [Pontibacter ummariensis]PRY12038.1 hypothetical protein CLV24_109163 [Pontibacter ummariensis]SNS57270.1 hypothetical protein SAMN06296052_1097 [Pontibacter ummariensis]
MLVFPYGSPLSVLTPGKGDFLFQISAKTSNGAVTFVFSLFSFQAANKCPTFGFGDTGAGRDRKPWFDDKTKQAARFHAGSSSSNQKSYYKFKN